MCIFNESKPPFEGEEQVSVSQFQSFFAYQILAFLKSEKMDYFLEFLLTKTINTFTFILSSHIIVICWMESGSTFLFAIAHEQLTNIGINQIIY